MINIGITGVGGGVGQSIIKSLQNSEYVLIGFDSEPLATGLYAVGKAFLIPYAVDNSYINILLNICKTNNIKLLFPGLDAELNILSKNKKRFAEEGINVIVSEEEVIKVSDDKLYTYEKLTGLGFHVPFTISMNSFEENKPFLSYPFVIKPQIGGTGSKNLYIIEKEQDYVEVLAKLSKWEDKFIIQEYIEGDEFTCGTVTLDNKCLGAIIMKRELRHGDTYKCHTIINPGLTEYLFNLMNILKPFGACNVQLRLKNNTPYIFEINARCSGTTAARTLCGFNEPLMVADYLLKHKRTKYTIKELTILRYWKELVVSNDEIKKLNIKNYLENNSINKL